MWYGAGKRNPGGSFQLAIQGTPVFLWKANAGRWLTHEIERERMTSYGLSSWSSKPFLYACRAQRTYGRGWPIAQLSRQRLKNKKEDAAALFVISWVLSLSDIHGFAHVVEYAGPSSTADMTSICQPRFCIAKASLLLTKFSENE